MSKHGGRLPEDAIYRDTGCRISPSCLRCPLPRCIYDEPNPRSAFALLRAEELLVAEKVIALRAAGSPVEVIAQEMGRSRRSIYRYLAAGQRELA